MATRTEKSGSCGVAEVGHIKKKKLGCTRREKSKGGAKSRKEGK